MLQIKQAVIVEGKYDKIKLSQFIDATIISTDGFRIFKDREKRQMIRALADTVGLLVITDSDSAGFQIRSYLRSITKDSPNVIHIYIPQITGKEKRKNSPSKEGFLGVEGLSTELLEKLLLQQQISCSRREESGKKIKKIDFYNWGLCGKENSAQQRQKLLQKLNLPSYMTVNSLLPVINALFDYSEFESFLEQLE